jgi:hypothetical protein
MKRKPATRRIGPPTVGEKSIQKEPARVVACQSCSSTVSRTFGSILISIFGAAGQAKADLRSTSVKCSNCGQPIDKNTMVRCEGDVEAALKEYVPCWEETKLVLVDETKLMQAQSAITGCGQCVPEPEMTFDYILDAVTGCDPTITEYMLCHPAICPRCKGEVTEKTLVIAH